jgi:hypothetical protein
MEVLGSLGCALKETVGPWAHLCFLLAHEECGLLHHMFPPLLFSTPPEVQSHRFPQS